MQPSHRNRRGGGGAGRGGGAGPGKSSGPDEPRTGAGSSAETGESPFAAGKQKPAGSRTAREGVQGNPSRAEGAEEERSQQSTEEGVGPVLRR
jgi:hypothetical protein